MAMDANVLVMQSGGSTAVWNRSLYGILDEAAARGGFGTIYGAVHGLEGLLARNVVRLSGLSGSGLLRIARTPGAALGSSRRMLREEDVPALMDTLSRLSISFCFIIGGNDSAETGHFMAMQARAAGTPLTVINVPKTIDNDLARTDHTPGYGSAARFVAMAAMGAGKDAEAMGRAAPVAVIEVMGRDAGWLAAASVLGKREDRDAPHVVCVPEVPVDTDRFVELVEAAYRRYGFAVAVVSERARGAEGVLGRQGNPLYVDDFGHEYHEGAGRYLSAAAGSALKVRVRYEKPGTIQRSMVASTSRSDAQEAEMVGRAAVRRALEGANSQMVTLVREPEPEYRCSTGLAPLEDVAGAVKSMPQSFLNANDYSIDDSFYSYAGPLVGPLPEFGRIS